MPIKYPVAANRLIRQLRLKPHPEGGFFRETYRAEKTTFTLRGWRPMATSIFFLLPKGERSRLHRIRSDEIWNFHLGGPLKIVEINLKGKVRETVLGPKNPQHVVPAAHWFGAVPMGKWTLVGCVVAPGFDFKDFEIAERETLLRKHPRAKKWILKLT